MDTLSLRYRRILDAKKSSIASEYSFDLDNNAASLSLLELMDFILERIDRNAEKLSIKNGALKADAIKSKIITNFIDFIENSNTQEICEKHILLSRKFCASGVLVRNDRTICNEKMVEVLTRRLLGETMTSIGTYLSISRERVRQLLDKLSPLLMIKISELTDYAHKVCSQIDEDVLMSNYKQYIEQYGCLPLPGEQLDQQIDLGEMGPTIQAMPIGLRVAEYERCGVAVPPAEYDFHYHAVHSGLIPFGCSAKNSYWTGDNALKHISEFIRRLAKDLGRPQDMPYQNELPTSVRGAVTGVGGQAVVANHLNLRYRGQLVGSGSRVYWTRERFADFAQRVSKHFGQDLDALPSHTQIDKYLRQNKDPEMTSRHVGSASSARKRFGCEYKKKVLFNFKSKTYEIVLQS